MADKKISCGGFYIDNNSLSLEDDKLSVKNGLPEIDSTDIGKVLTVNEDSVPVWAESGGGGGSDVLLVTVTEQTLNKTWKEIHDAAPLVWISDDGSFFPLAACWEESGSYGVSFVEFSDPLVLLEYAASSADGYPTDAK